MPTYKNIIFDICGVLFEYASVRRDRAHGNTFKPIESGIDILKKLHMKTDNNGNKIFRFFGCTNMSESRKKILISEYPEITMLFEDIITSEKAGYPKPDTRIFRFLCDLYGLQAKESIFIDDNQEFVQSARSIGMSGIWFSTIQQVIQGFEKIGIFIVD